MFRLFSIAFLSSLLSLIFACQTSAQLLEPDYNNFGTIILRTSQSGVNAVAKNSVTGGKIDECTLPCSLKINTAAKVEITFSADNKRSILIPVTLPEGMAYPRIYHVKLLDREDAKLANRKASPMLQVVARAPESARKSGYCDMVFDISKSGLPTNIRATDCAHSMFKKASISAVKKWRFYPQIVDGKRTETKNRTGRVEYVILRPDDSVMEYYGGSGYPVDDPF